MKNKLCFLLTVLLIFSCASEKKIPNKNPEIYTSWNIIDGIMMKKWNKHQIENILGKASKSLNDGTNIYLDQDSKMQSFAVEYTTNGRVLSFSFTPQEHEALEFSYGNIKSRWNNFNCIDNKEQIVHPDYIENKNWFECTNHAKVHYSNKKEILYILFKE